MRTLLLLSAACITAWPLSSSAICYSMFDAKDELVYRSTMTPIDLSQSIAREMQQKFPGHRLLITDNTECTVFSASNSVSAIFGPASGIINAGSTARGYARSDGANVDSDARFMPERGGVRR